MSRAAGSGTQSGAGAEKVAFASFFSRAALWLPFAKHVALSMTSVYTVGGQSVAPQKTYESEGFP